MPLERDCLQRPCYTRAYAVMRNSHVSAIPHASRKNCVCPLSLTPLARTVSVSAIPHASRKNCECVRYPSRLSQELAVSVSAIPHASRKSVRFLSSRSRKTSPLSSRPARASVSLSPPSQSRDPSPPLARAVSVSAIPHASRKSCECVRYPSRLSKQLRCPSSRSQELSGPILTPLARAVSVSAIPHASRKSCECVRYPSRLSQEL
ncbi:hypothetical protein J6590_056389 [Homalodisca vitripennis]|nr:hypothetical protein J6590_056389 [Homalodisca vitripennis]